MRFLPQAAWLQVVLHQGWNRQIKRMGEAVGHPVLKLKRVAYGVLKLGKITPGTTDRSLLQKFSGYTVWCILMRSRSKGNG